MWMRGDCKPTDFSFNGAGKQQVKEQIASSSRQVLTLLFDMMAGTAHEHHAFGFSGRKGEERCLKTVLYRHHLPCEH